MTRNDVMKALEEYSASIIDPDTQGVVIIVTDSEGFSVTRTDNINLAGTLIAAITNQDEASETHTEYGASN